MRNKVEFKKALILSIAIILIGILIFEIVNYYQYKKYTQNFNEKLVAILNNIDDNELDKTKIVEILNGSTDYNINFSNYGIDINNDSLILENDQYYKQFAITNLSIIVVLSLCLMAVFIKYNVNKDKRFREIVKYIKQINNKDYKLDIQDNTEDELSILKNDLYKITVSLKEAAENSSKDKILLKNSLSDISHQLKTPLTSITITLDNILENQEMNDSMRNKFVYDIKREILNINFLVNSLLKLSRLDANSVNFINKEEKVENIIYEGIKNVSALCDLKNIVIEVRGDNKATIICDFMWQVEAVTNILKNGIEHSKENSKIIVSIEENKLYTQIKIRDFGIGIDEKDLSHIFERFYKGKNSSSESVGIGLALAKSIIEKNNGIISVSSNLEEGTVFNLKFFK